MRKDCFQWSTDLEPSRRPPALVRGTGVYIVARQKNNLPPLPAPPFFFNSLVVIAIKIIVIEIYVFSGKKTVLFNICLLINLL